MEVKEWCCGFCDFRDVSSLEVSRHTKEVHWMWCEPCANWRRKDEEHLCQKNQ